MSLEDIFLGVHDKTNDFVNTVIIIIKYSIYKAWLRKTKPTFNLLIEDIKEVMQTEHKIALKKMKLEN